MQIVKSVSAMQRMSKRWQRQGIRVGLVPTMGYLHEGHLSLVSCARKLVGSKGTVVVSIYVNPTQFAPQEDFSRYPRDLKGDADLCRTEGVDVIFAPDDDGMYPRKSAEAYSTYVTEETLSRTMEGASRPTHFRGVTTVVAKLFNVVQPGWAVFGAKDFQQAAVIRRMTRDLNLPVKIVVAPTYRESDGLAMSSRNKYLVGDLRRQAVVLSRSLKMAQTELRRSRGLSARLLKAKLKRFIEREPAARVDYIEFFSPETLKPVDKVERGVQIALAVFIGKTRLIDNCRL
jgi:pantoate--beta-alanine ligase